MKTSSTKKASMATPEQVPTLKQRIASLVTLEKGSPVSANRFFVYAVELTLLFVLVFATVSTFAQTRANALSDPNKLDLVKQTIVCNSGKVYLNWIAKSNATDCIYVVERSEDGDDFEPVGLKEGVGSPVELLYSWVDIKPLHGTAYYRIKQVNDEGKLVAQADAQEIKVNQGPLFLDRSNTMVKAK